MWLVLVLIATILGGLAAVFAKQSNQLNGVKATIIFWLFWYHVLTIIIVAVIRPEYIIGFSFIDLFKILPLITIQTLGFIFSIKALHYAKASLITPIQRVSVVLSIALGVLILGEIVTLLQLFISALLIGLVIYLGYISSNKSGKNENLKKGLIYAFLSLPFIGSTVVLYKPYLNFYVDPWIVLFYGAVNALIFLSIYLTIKKDWSNITLKKVNAKWTLIIATLVDLGAGVFHRFSIIDGKVSVISVITTSSLVVTLLVSRVCIKDKLCLRERLTFKQYLVIAGIIICVAVLSLLKV